MNKYIELILITILKKGDRNSKKYDENHNLVLIQEFEKVNSWNEVES